MAGRIIQIANVDKAVEDALERDTGRKRRITSGTPFASGFAESRGVAVNWATMQIWFAEFSPFVELLQTPFRIHRKPFCGSFSQ